MIEKIYKLDVKSDGYLVRFTKGLDVETYIVQEKGITAASAFYVSAKALHEKFPNGDMTEWSATVQYMKPSDVREAQKAHNRDVKANKTK